MAPVHRVLAVDDSRSILEYLESAFKGSGIGLDIADCPTKAIAFTSVYPFALILTDNDLGYEKLKGYELVEELERRGSKTPVIAMSGDMDDELREKYLQLTNVVATTQKPFLDINIVELVRSHINKEKKEGGE